MSASADAVDMLCPGCDGHLGDTWDFDDDRCQKCGFEFETVVDYGGSDERRREVQQRTTSHWWQAFKRITAGGFAAIYAVASVIAPTEGYALLTLVAAFALWSYFLLGGGSA